MAILTSKFHGKWGSSVHLLFRGLWLKNKMMESCSNIGDVDTTGYLRAFSFVDHAASTECYIQFPTEQYETNASEKTLLRDLQEYQKDQRFKYLNESTVPFILVGAGEGAHTPDEFAAWKSYFEWAMTHSCKASGNVFNNSQALCRRQHSSECERWVHGNDKLLCSAVWLRTWLWLWGGVSHLLQIQSQQVEEQHQGNNDAIRRIKDSPQHGWEETAECDKPFLYLWGVLK